ncbi:MAG: biopolymer transporter ExbD, partial [Planctomycetota bacterium]|nr:biopolymer transporter ExbD [Planctomycetota bacterium]
MPLKGADRTEESAINLTPMIDIVFLLVIFFMVGARFTE